MRKNSETRSGRVGVRRDRGLRVRRPAGNHDSRRQPMADDGSRDRHFHDRRESPFEYFSIHLCVETVGRIRTVRLWCLGWPKAGNALPRTSGR